MSSLCIDLGALGDLAVQLSILLRAAEAQEPISEVLGAFEAGGHPCTEVDVIMHTTAIHALDGCIAQILASIFGIIGIMFVGAADPFPDVACHIQRADP